VFELLRIRLGGQAIAARVSAQSQNVPFFGKLKMSPFWRRKEPLA
jgi:hypothetical protein